MTIKAKYLAIKVSKGIKYIVFSTNVIMILLLILSTLAPKTPPSSNIFIAYLGMGFPILLIINIIYLVFWTVFLQWKYILVCLASFAFCWNTISTYISFHSPVESIPYDCIKVLSYNVRGFNWLTGEEARNNPILNYIAGTDADIICMQEFAVEEKKNMKNLISIDEFDKIMESYPYRTIIRLGDTTGSIIYGLACYSKFPIMKVARVPIESDFNGSAMYEIRVGWKRITIVNNHLESNKITEEDKELYKEFIETHNRALIGDVAQNIQERLIPAFVKREEQANTIAAAIQKQRENTHAIIVCGDFNDTPVSYAYNTILGNMVDAFKATGLGLGITFNEKLFLLRIDYIMHTRNIRSYNCTVDRVMYSDHYPVWANLHIRYI